MKSFIRARAGAIGLVMFGAQACVSIPMSLPPDWIAYKNNMVKPFQGQIDEAKSICEQASSGLNTVPAKHHKNPQFLLIKNKMDSNNKRFEKMTLDYKNLNEWIAETEKAAFFPESAIGELSSRISMLSVAAGTVNGDCRGIDPQVGAFMATSH